MVALLTVALALGSFFMDIRKFSADPLFLLLIAVSVLLWGWAATVYYVNDLYPWALRRLGHIGLGIAVVCAVYVIVDTLPKVLVLSGAIIASTLGSALFGIAIQIEMEPFIRAWFAVSDITELTAYNVLEIGRTAGVSNSVISFSYHLVVAVLIAIGLVLLVPFQRAGAISSMILVMALVGLGLALLNNASRSAVLGVAVALSLILLLVFPRMERSMLWKSLTIFLAAGVTIFVVMASVDRLSFHERLLSDRGYSSRARAPMAITALEYAREHSLGTATYSPELRHMPLEMMENDPVVVEQVMKNTPHNQFLVILVYYGIPGFVLLICFYIVVLLCLYYNVRTTLMRGDLRMLVVAAAIAGAILAYLVNSLFHNKGPFVGDWYHWIVMGMAFAIRKLIGENSLRRPDYTIENMMHGIKRLLIK